MSPRVFAQRGGGVYISSGAVTFNECSIYDNEAYVRCPPSPAVTAIPSGRWKKFPGTNLCARVWWQWGGGVYISGSSTVVEFNGCSIYGNEANVRRPPCPAVTAIPAGRWKTFPRSVPDVPPQDGGGVYINYIAGTVTFTDCEIYSNTAYDVSIVPTRSL